MNIGSQYLGLHLANPLVCGAGPLGANLDSIRQLEDAGIAAVVLPSLFEEEIRAAVESHLEIEAAGSGFAEATSYLPDPEGYHLGPNRYFDHLRKAKETVSIPVIGSLNGTTPGGWTGYARNMQEAGADAIELNIYFLSTDAEETGEQVEQRTLEIVQAVKQTVTIPVAVKCSPFVSSIPNFARKLEEVGADGLVLFNRFYQPDIDVEELDVVPDLHLSSPTELRLRLRWLAILSGQVQLSLAATGGAHSTLDVIKAVMSGAHAVQLVSALLIRGPGVITKIVQEVTEWLQEHEYESLEQMQGSMNLEKTPNPAAFTRANYMQMLDSWHG